MQISIIDLTKIFLKIVKVNQTTIESYLEDIITENINFTAEDIAKFDIEIMAKELNDNAYKTASEMDYLRTEEVVSDLVHHFLIPEVIYNYDLLFMIIILN